MEKAAYFMRVHELTQRFFVVEGCDGAGKTSFCVRLAHELSVRGYDVVATREPGGSVVATLIRKLLCGVEGEQLTVESECALFCAARSQHLKEKVIPALKNQKVVICDRYVDSTRVYQGHLHDVCSEQMESLIELTSYGLKPQLTFLLDGDESVFRSRVHTQHRDDQSNRFDQLSLECYQKIGRGFRQLAAQNPAAYQVLCADQHSLDHLVQQAIPKVISQLEPRSSF